MKHALRAIVFAVVLPLGAIVTLPAFAVPLSEPSLQRVAVRFSQSVIHIPGMTCSNQSCAVTVYISLIRLPGVMGVGVDESNQDVTVKYVPGRTSPSAFLKAVKNAGFPGTLVTKGST
ncbi:MAG TPA: cation transporter [Acidiferrobacter sp.]|nr:cation transporter [Acidiferrobacter sp.]